MAMKKCPRCNKAVAQRVEKCPYCSYDFFNAQSHYDSLAHKKEGCSVVLKSYKGSLLHAKRLLSETIDSSLTQAQLILQNLPYTLYSELSANNAERLCRQLQRFGFSCEMSNDKGEITTYKPSMLQGLFCDKEFRKHKQKIENPSPFLKRPKGVAKKH